MAELLKKLIDFLIRLYERFEQKEIMKQEKTRIETEQTEKTNKELSERKPKKIKKPKKDDFFSDEDGW